MCQLIATPRPNSRFRPRLCDRVAFKQLAAGVSVARFTVHFHGLYQHLSTVAAPEWRCLWRAGSQINVAANGRGGDVSEMKMVVVWRALIFEPELEH